MSKLNSFFFRFKKYLHYWLNNVDGHSLHSPFVFGFYNDVLHGKSNTSDFEGIENLRSFLLKDTRVLEINDLGAGSSVNKSTNRKVKDIAKYSLASPKSSQLYHRLIAYFEAKNILELGASLGINTLYLASNYSVEKVITVEGCQQTAQIAKDNFSGLFNDKITLINADVTLAFSEISHQVSQLDFILIDANHTYEATLEYYRLCKPFLHEGSVIIFDDIYWSEGMSKAWREIIKDVEVTLSLDLFEMGIVFFKKDLQKENYVLKW